MKHPSEWKEVTFLEMTLLQKLYAALTTWAFLSMNITVNGLREECDSETCLSLCCSPGIAQLDGKCVQDNATFLILPETNTSADNTQIRRGSSDQKFRLITDDPCDVDWMVSSVLTNFQILPNGSIYAPDFRERSLFDTEHYCLFRKPESKIFLAKVCYPWIIKVNWQIGCLVFSGLGMLAIFIVYSIVPELKNLHGLVFRSYAATYIGAHICVVGQQLTADSRSNAHLFTFFVFFLHYCAGSCALWLNVMSLNIWRTFRGLRSIESNTKERERKKFFLYAIYAWVSPGILHLAILAVMLYVPYFHKLALNQTLVLWTCAAFLTTIAVCNAFLFASTALRISQHKKDTANVINEVNKHHESEKQWFNLHVKLFMITGAHTIMWVIWELWPIPINTVLMIAVEVVQTILIFIIFIWKDNVKRSLRKQFDDTLCRMQSTFGTSHTTPTNGV